jgi:hypothetical protein
MVIPHRLGQPGSTRKCTVENIKIAGEKTYNNMKVLKKARSRLEQIVDQAPTLDCPFVVMAGLGPAIHEQFPAIRGPPGQARGRRKLDAISRNQSRSKTLSPIGRDVSLVSRV